MATSSTRVGKAAQRVSPDPTGSPDPVRRPGGRSARVRDDVYAAVGYLVGEGHLETMTIPQVAARAGVNPTSIYRRWGTIEALCGEVAVAALTQGGELPDTGTLTGDLEIWGQIIAEDIERPARLTYLRALAASRTGLIASCPCWDQRSVQATLMLERAAARGERVPAAHQVLDHLIAPLYHHAVFGLPGGPGYAERLVRDLMSMCHGSAGVDDGADRPVVRTG